MLQLVLHLLFWQKFFLKTNNYGKHEITITTQNKHNNYIPCALLEQILWRRASELATACSRHRHLRAETTDAETRTCPAATQPVQDEDSAAVAVVIRSQAVASRHRGHAAVLVCVQNDRRARVHAR